MKNGMFEASDFCDFFPQNLCKAHDDYDCSGNFNSERANIMLLTLKAQWLEELLRDAPVVEGWGISQGEWYAPTYKAGFDSESTHRGRLICIEGIST